MNPVMNNNIKSPHLKILSGLMMEMYCRNSTDPHLTTLEMITLKKLVVTVNLNKLLDDSCFHDKVDHIFHALVLSSLVASIK